jgi:hypothetical protein
MCQLSLRFTTLALILTAWEFKKPFFFVKMKISPGWLRQNILLIIKKASQKILTNFFVSEVFIKNKKSSGPYR